MECKIIKQISYGIRIGLYEVSIDNLHKNITLIYRRHSDGNNLFRLSPLIEGELIKCKIIRKSTSSIDVVNV